MIVIVILYPQHNKDIGLHSPFFGINFINPVRKMLLISLLSKPSFAALLFWSIIFLLKKYDTPSHPHDEFIFDHFSNDFFSSSNVTPPSRLCFSTLLCLLTWPHLSPTKKILYLYKSTASFFFLVHVIVISSYVFPPLFTTTKLFSLVITNSLSTVLSSPSFSFPKLKKIPVGFSLFCSRIFREGHLPGGQWWPDGQPGSYWPLI